MNSKPNIKLQLPDEKSIEMPLEAIVEIVAMEEDIPIRGNVIFGVDPKETKKAEDQIIRRRKTNIWAWCSVQITARIGQYEGTSCLGACSYKSAKDFKENSGYYPQMEEEAIAELMKALEAAMPELAKT